MTLRKRYSYSSWAVFGLGLLVAAAAFLPYVIYHGGYFFYYGDFNVQQIPFYQLAHEAIRSGNVRWSWVTDLGANFVGSYSFYLLFSPFFWLTIPFPTSFLPYLMAPLLVLKSACAAVTAFWFLRRFIADEKCAAYCSLLYAFSGFSVYNIFFNHFHEAIVFFPLLLLGLEMAMVDKRKGAFACAIAINAVVNYWFFIGEAVFVALYFFVRLSSPDWRLTARRFAGLAVEVICGMGLAMFAFLPSVLAIMGNPRATSETLLLGGNLWYYSNPQRYLGIIHSFFFAPDPPALNNFFPDHGAQWSSLSCYLPVVGASCSLAYFISVKRDWLKKMLGASALMALVPLGNHLFVAMNHSYYARWFYMPTLLLVLATAFVLENPDKYRLETGLKIQIWAVLIILVISGLTPGRNDDGEITFGLFRYFEEFLATTAITLVGLAIFIAAFRRYRSGRPWRGFCQGGILVGCFLFTFCTMLIGKVAYPNNNWLTEYALPGRDRMLVSDETFARSDIYQGSDNLGMYWNIPNIQAFHSIVPASLMEFYPDVGVKRDVSSKPEVKYPQLRSFLSVRWLYINAKYSEQEPMPGYTFVEERMGFNIYENDNWLPMGFSYDYYINRSDWDSLPTDYRSRLILYGVCLEDDAIARNSDILAYRPEDDWMPHLAENDWVSDVELRRSMTCDSFEVTKTGFTAMSSFDRERLVLFSVPYDKGWSATVNGEEVLVEKANIGFVAVRVPAGDASIVFTYQTPGLYAGSVISLVSLLLLLAYLALCRARPGIFDPKDPPRWEQLSLAGAESSALLQPAVPAGDPEEAPQNSPETGLDSAQAGAAESGPPSERPKPDPDGAEPSSDDGSEENSVSGGLNKGTTP